MTITYSPAPMPEGLSDLAQKEWKHHVFIETVDGCWIVLPNVTDNPTGVESLNDAVVFMEEEDMRKCLEELAVENEGL